MKYTALITLLISAGFAPLAAADNIADCELLIAERVKDEATNGSALISSYRPAGAFMSSVYDDEEGHLNEVEGHKIRAVFCERRSAIPTLRDYPILETGIPLSLSQNFDSALSDVILVQFKDGQFRSVYSGKGLSETAQTELDDVMAVFNLQPNDLAAREEEVKAVRAEIEKADDSVSETSDDDASNIFDDTDNLSNDISVGLDLSVDENINDFPIDSFDIDDHNLEPDLLDEDDGLIEIARDEIKSKNEVSEAYQIDDISKQPSAENTGPTAKLSQDFDATCQMIFTNAAGAMIELPVSGTGLQNSLVASDDFMFPAPKGFKLNRIKCKRDSLTPEVYDYKVALAGYPFLYFVIDDNGASNRMAALEFVDGKYRMNLLDGDFTDQELIDAKARILSFNKQNLDDDVIKENGE